MKAGKTQQGMADFLGCQVRHYQLIEAGGSNLPIPKLMKVADYFACRWTIFWGGRRTGRSTADPGGETEVFPAVLVPAFTQDGGPCLPFPDL